MYIYIHICICTHGNFYTILTGNAHFRQGFVHKSSCAPPSAAAPHTEDVSYGRGFRWPDDRGFPAASRQCLVGFHMSLPLLTTTYSYRCCGMINYNSTSFCCIIVYRRVTCNNPWITLLRVRCVTCLSFCRIIVDAFKHPAHGEEMLKMIQNFGLNQCVLVIYVIQHLKSKHNPTTFRGTVYSSPTSHTNRLFSDKGSSW